MSDEAPVSSTDKPRDVTLDDFGDAARLPLWQRELLLHVRRGLRDRALQAKPPQEPPPAPRTHEEWAAALDAALRERI